MTYSGQAELFDRLKSALGDRYRVERELGHGGMAIVFLAEDLKHQRRVAIKVLKPELAAVVGSDRFLREISIAATLQHPHILPLYDSGQADGLLYYVMPFVEGESLRERLAREPQLPLETALQIVREVGSALGYAHEHGVIHRDIKPDNIMLTGGHAVVADFGIARAVDAAGADQITVSGMYVGTPQYMSPEQAGSTAVDGRSDQYSLACVLYEMLIGQPPFSGTTPVMILARHSHDSVPGLRIVRPAVPTTVENTILRAMAKLPVDRFDSMRGFLDAIDLPETSPVHLATPTATPSPHSMRWGRGATIALAAGVLSAVAWWIVAGRPLGPTRAVSGGITAIAVLPFEDLTSDSTGSFLGVGMTEGLIADLAQISSLRVLSRSAGAAAQGPTRSLAELARELGVKGVVRGSIGRMGDSVWVSVRLLHAPDSATVFAKDYRRRLGELPELQREITLGITQSTRTKLKGEEKSRLDATRVVDPRAYEAYLRGRFHLEHDELEPARMQFEQAGKIAPGWAPPHVGLANYYTSLPFAKDVSPAMVLPKARASLALALELDETLAEAHAANAYIRAYYDWDYRAAEREFRRALELRPNYADAYFSYSRFLASRRRFDEAVAQLGHAVELDPLSLLLHANRALLDYFAGHYDQADSGLREVLEVDSTDVLAQWGLALVAEQQGRLDDAIRILEPISRVSLNRKSSLGHVYGMAGRSVEARDVLRALHDAEAHSYVSAYYFALVHAGLGERDQALRYLERSYEERSTVLAYLSIDPRLASLRNDPRFQALALRIGGE